MRALRTRRLAAVGKSPVGAKTDGLILLGQGFGINPLLAGAPPPVDAGSTPGAVVPPVRTEAALPTSFGPMESSPSLYFAEELTLPAKSVTSKPTESKQPIATQSAVRPHLAAAATSVIHELPDDLDIEVAGELVRQDDGFGAPAPPRAAPVVAAVARFEPLEVEYDYYAGTAFELNFRNDGLNLPAHPVLHTTKTDLPAPQSAREISRAVKLTRDALYAWVNIFTGPALVTVSDSN